MNDQERWDSYFQDPPQNTTLRNKLGITDPDTLEVFEHIRVREEIDRTRELVATSDLSYETFKTAHKQLFGKVYDWAGEERNVNMSKEGHVYLDWNNIADEANREFARLKDANYLQGLQGDAFVSALSDHWGTINEIHPFREGNSRTQVMFFEGLCKRANHTLDTDMFSNPTFRAAFNSARYIGMEDGNYEQLGTVLSIALQPDDTATTVSESQQLLKDTFIPPRPSKGPTAKDLNSTKRPKGPGSGPALER